MDLPIVAVMVTFVLVAVAFVSLVAAAVAWHASRRAGLELDDVRRGIGGGAHSAQRNVRELRASLDGARLQADRLEGALDTIELGLLVLDPAARLVHSNAAAARFVGARHGEAVAERRIHELVDRVGTTGSAEVVELELFTPRRRLLGLRATPLGDALGTVVVIEDRTREQRIDSMRRDFVANVSHELKTPLGAMSVLAESMASTTDVEVLRRLGDRLSAQSTHMARLVDDLLDLSMVESAMGPTEPVILTEVIEEATRRVSATAEAGAVSILHTPPTTSIVFEGNRRQLESALTNLLDNAVKYSSSDAGGSGSEVTITTRSEPGSVSIAVRDSGPGIGEVHLQRIFERFYRVDQSRSSTTGGTGLGLSIARHVALNHGGDVEVSSVVGEGSTFTLVLPVKEPIQ